MLLLLVHHTLALALSVLENLINQDGCYLNLITISTMLEEVIASFPLHMLGLESEGDVILLLPPGHGHIQG